MKYHVLLIGIDAYDGPASLSGCVNDIDAIQAVLLERVGVGEDRITRLAAPVDDRQGPLPAAEPTLANIRAALERLGTEEVEPGDRVFIHYSGHGTQLRVVEPSGVTYVREALLPSDHLDRTARRYLFDWELNALLARIAARTTAITVVLDCCCAAGATRDGLDPAGARPRFWPIEEPYRLPADRAPPEQGSLRGVAGGIPAAVSACQVAAACMDDERARESTAGAGRAHGELTRALLHQLELIEGEALPELRWAGSGARSRPRWRRGTRPSTRGSPAGSRAACSAGRPRTATPATA